MALVEYEINNHCLLISLNRPEKRNAFNAALIKLLINILQQHQTNESLHAVLFTGNGEHFCAGADIAHMHDVAHMSHVENKADAALIAELLTTIYQFPIPTIALAHGTTLGGGLGILSACDIALATDNAQFGFSEIKIGIAPSTISPYVIQAIGRRYAQYYFLTGERFNAQEAYRIGLVHQVIEIKNLPTIIDKIIEQFASSSNSALRAIKKLLQQSNMITEKTIEFTIDHLANLRAGDEAKEGLQAFLEKRAPVWHKDQS